MDSNRKIWLNFLTMIIFTTVHFPYDVITRDQQRIVGCLVSVWEKISLGFPLCCLYLRTLMNYLMKEETIIMPNA